jgi:hypothetical protein
MRSVDMKAQPTFAEGSLSDTSAPCPMPLPTRRFFPHSMAMKAFRFGCGAGSIEAMSPHIFSMRASAIQRSISAILFAANPIHTRTAFAHAPALTCGGKLPEGSQASPFGRRANGSVRSFGWSVSYAVQPKCPSQDVSDGIPAVAVPDSDDSRRDFGDSSMNAVYRLTDGFA